MDRSRATFRIRRSAIREHFEYIPEPYGVVGHVITWNAPALSLAMKVPASLAAGNTVVIVLNGRSNAPRNRWLRCGLRWPSPTTSPRMIRDPLCLLDMDVPVDGADAFVLTSIEHARDLPHRPVLVHAATAGLSAPVEEDQIVGLHQHGQHVVVEELRAQSDLWLPDIDDYFPYDGFGFLTLSWLEAVGWCGRDIEAAAFGKVFAEPAVEALLGIALPRGCPVRTKQTGTVAVVNCWWRTFRRLDPRSEGVTGLRARRRTPDEGRR